MVSPGKQKPRRNYCAEISMGAAPVRKEAEAWGVWKTIQINAVQIPSRRRGRVWGGGILHSHLV